jgi:hypothetical protein
MKIDNRSFGRVQKVNYLETTLTNQNSIQKKLRADGSQGMLVIIRCRIFCVPVFSHIKKTLFMYTNAVFYTL